MDSHLRQLHKAFHKFDILTKKVIPEKSCPNGAFLFSCYSSSQGGFDYKKAIVDTIITVIEENSEAKEAGNNSFWALSSRVALCVL